MLAPALSGAALWELLSLQDACKNWPSQCADLDVAPKTQQVTRGIRGPGRVERRKGVFGSGAYRVNHGLRLALRSVDGDIKSVANRDQAGDSLSPKGKPQEKGFALPDPRKEVMSTVFVELNGRPSV